VKADELHKGDDGRGPLHILVADVDCALFGLLEAWLGSCNCRLASACQPEEGLREGYDAIVVDIPFPRQGGLDVLKDLARAHPGTPIVALSSNFLPGVSASGSVARELGIASVLPKPVTREALIAAVQEAVHKR
jgi:CheY-like chemotaxis protein